VLDVQSTSKGMLIPRLTTSQRTTIGSPATGLLVYDTQTKSFWFYDVSWKEIYGSNNNTILADTDGDTKVEVEQTSDEDAISLTIAGTEFFVFDGAHMNVLNSGGSVFIGENAGINDDYSSNSNVAIGKNALEDNTVGGFNIAIGNYTLNNNVAKSGNIAIGNNAMRYFNNSATLGSPYSTAIGMNSLTGSSTPASNTGTYNTAVGAFSLNKNTSGYNNVAVGNNSLTDNTVGYSNSGLGYHSLSNNTTGRFNTAVGTNALYSNVAKGGNTAIGYYAMYYANSSTSATISSNTAIGYGALRGSTNSSNNTGTLNVSIGSSTLYNNTSGSYNAVLGHYALNSNTTGSNNVAIGYYAGDDNLTGNYNILIGDNVNALYGSSSNRMNIGNTIYGTGMYQSTYKIGIGVASPDEALDVRGTLQVKNSSGLGNIIIDGTSGNSEVTFNHGGAYGGAFGYNITNDNLFLYHGGSVVLKDGQFGVGTTTPGYKLQVGNIGDGTSARANAWNTFSDRRWKTNINVIDNPIEKLSMINGYYYNWKDSEDKSIQVGVLAQEVEEVLPEIVSTDAEGYKSVDYSKITALLIEVNKAQQIELEALKNSVQQQNEKIEQLIKLVSEK
ncbi:MAG: tail fiber domain-containing protein, partial [Bacteroidota bacterium]